MTFDNSWDPVLALARCDEQLGVCVSIEDNGITAFAYLERLADAQICSSVWLYNHPGVCLEHAELTPQGDLRRPAPNPDRYVSDRAFVPLTGDGEAEVFFTGSGSDDAGAQIYLRGALHAFLEVRG